MSFLLPIQRVIQKIRQILEITVIKKIETIGDMPDTTPKGSEGTAFKQNTAGVGAWVSPTNFSDPDGEWENEVLAYDGSTATMAQTDLIEDTWTSFLIFTLASIKASRIRVYIPQLTDDPASDVVDIDVYRDGVWVDVKEWMPTIGWEWISFSEGNVTQVRIRFKPSQSVPDMSAIGEVGLWQVPATGGEMVVKQLEKDRTVTLGTDTGILTNFSTNVTGDVKTPDVGYHLRVLAAFYYCPEDVITELRFKEGGGLVLALPTKGAIGMNLLFVTKPKGGVNETLELFIDGTALCKGWVITSQSLT
jgi:hypothetical protein